MVWGMVAAANVKANQLGGRLPSCFEHVFREPENPVDRPHDHRTVLDECSLPANPFHPSGPFQFQERFARRGIAYRVFLDDLVFRKHGTAGRQLSLLDLANNIAADLKVFRQAESFV